MTRRKIVLRFIVGADGDNNYLYKKVTLRHIRPELSDEKMSEFVAHYCSLTANILEEAVVVDERTLVIEEEVEVFEETPEAKKETTALKVEKEVDPPKGETTASAKEPEADSVALKEGINPLAAPEKRSQLQSDKEAKRSGQAFPPQKKQPLNQAALTDLKSAIRKEFGLETKGQERSDIKNQSPPTVKVGSPVLKRKERKRLAKGSEVLEEEIEIWLDDDQDLSVDALVAVVQEAMESKQVTYGAPHPSQDSKEEFMEVGLPNPDGSLFQPFMMPIKKKRMQPPIGKRTKPTKKKRRS